jgi:NADPH2:quinone reductase
MARIVEITRTGEPEVIEWVERALPEPGEGEVRIRSTAVGLNFIDIYHRRGSYKIPLPSGLGGESVGVIEAIGPGVTGFDEGDRVGALGPELGAYATHRNLPAERLVRLPNSVDDQTAAALLL